MSKLQTVFMFSGQGSQYFQMGKSLFASNPAFRSHMLRLDAHVRELTGHSVVDALYAPANKIGMPFDRTLLSHPAIVMVEYALAQTLMEAGVTPDFVLGASLGSYTAASVAGALPIDDALALAVNHAQALETCCGAGGMIAILAGPELFDEPFLRDRAERAAVNFDSHFVVSAPRADCDALEHALRERDLAFQRIPVSFAFHSRWMDAARDEFDARTRSIRSGPARLPIVCCDRCDTLTALPADYFWDVTRHPIRFPEAISRLEQQGAYRYLDVGPSGTLALFLKYLLPQSSQSSAHTILTPYGQDTANLERLMAVC